MATPREVFDQLARHFDDLADAAEGTIASLEAITQEGGADLRAASIKYAAGRRDALRGAAATVREAAGL